MKPIHAQRTHPIAWDGLWVQLEVMADLCADVAETHTCMTPSPPLPLAPAASCPRRTCSLAEVGPVGAVKRQSCREMKSELLWLGLQGRLSFPINNSGFPWGWEDDIISHPIPTATFPFPSLFLIILLNFVQQEIWRHVGTKLCVLLRPYLPQTARGSPSTFTGQRKKKGERDNFLFSIFYFYFLCLTFSHWVWSSSDGFAQLARTAWFCIFLEWIVEKKVSEDPSKFHVRKQDLDFASCRQKAGEDPAVCRAVLEGFPGGDTGYRWGYRGAGFHHGEHR